MGSMFRGHGDAQIMDFFLMLKKGCAFGLPFLLPLMGMAQTITVDQPQGCINQGSSSTVVEFSLSGVPEPCAATWTLTPGYVNVPACPDLNVALEEGCYEVSATYNGTTYQYGQYCVWKRPVPSFTQSLTVGCTGSCVVFTDTSDPGSAGAEIATWNWSPASGNVPNFNHCYPDEGIYVPSLQVIADNGCANIGVVYGTPIEIVYDPPIADFTGGLMDCHAPVSIGYNAIGSMTSPTTTPVTYAWTVDPPANIGDPTAMAPTVNFPSTGDYTLCLTVTNSIGCTDQICNDVEIFDAPDLVVGPISSAFCNGSQVQFSTEGTVPVPPPGSVSWDVGCDGSNEGYGTVWGCAFSASNGVCVHIAYSPNCTAGDSLHVEVLEEPVADFSPENDITLCSTSQDTTFTSTSTGTGLSYAWTVNGGPVESTDSQFMSAFTANSTVTLTVTNASGCSDAKTINVTIDLPELTLMAPTGVCAGDEIAPVTSIPTVIPGEQPYVYTWEIDGVVTLPPLSFPVGTPAGAHELCQTLTTASGCEVQDCTNIQVSPQLEAIFAPLSAQCIGDTVVLCADNVNATSYAWQFQQTSPPNTIWNLEPYFSTDTCISYLFNNIDFEQGANFNGIVCFDVTLTIDNDGCSSETTIADAVCLWGPEANFNFTQDCSDPFVVSFTDASWAATELEWDFGDGTGHLIGTSTNPGIHAPSHVYGQEGTYNVCLTASADTGSCPHTYCQTVWIDEPSANLSFTPTTGCSPLCVQFTPDNEPFNTYWHVDFGNDVTLEAEVSSGTYPDFSVWAVTFDSLGTTADYFYNVPYTTDANFFPTCVWYTGLGNYTIVVQDSNLNGCSANMDYTNAITITNDPVFATFTGNIDMDNACEELCINLEADNVLDNYAWNYRTTAGGGWNPINPGNTSDAYLCIGPPRPSFLEVQLEGDQGTCDDSWVHEITIPELPTADFTISDPTPCVGDEVVFNATVNNLPTNAYTWTIDEVPVPGSAVMDYIFTANGTYSICLVVTDPTYGCKDTLCQNVVVFTPVPDIQIAVTKDPVYCTYELCMEDISDCPGCDYLWTYTELTPNPDLVYNSQSHSFNPGCRDFNPGIVNAQLVVTAANGCTETVNMPDVFGLEEVYGPWSVLSENALCAPYCATFTAFNTNLAGFTYSWAFGDFCDGTGVDAPVAQHCFTCSGNFMPTLELTDADGCEYTIPSVAPIVVKDYVVNATVLPAEICAGDTAQLELVAADPDFGINSVDFNPVGNVIDPNHPLPPTTWDVTGPVGYTAHYAQCEFVGVVDLIVHPLPVLTAASYGPFCSSEGVQEYPVVEPVPPPGSASWSSSLPEPDWSDFPPDPHGDPLTGGPHSITYHYTDGNGCTDSLAIPFTIHDTTVVNWNETLLHICQGAVPVPLAPMVDVHPGTFQVEYGNGWVSATEFDPDLTTSNCGAVPVRYIYQNANACVSINDAVMTIHPLPEPDFTFNPSVLCLGDSLYTVDASNIDCGTITSWAWQVDGSPYGSVQDFEPILFGSCGMHEVSLQVTSEWGCTAGLEQDVEIHCLPVLAAEPYGPFCINEGLLPCPTVSPAPGTGSASSWSPFSCPADPLILLSGNTSITYHYADAFGCVDSLDISFTIHDTTDVNWNADLLQICQGAAPVPLMPMVDHTPGIFEVDYGTGNGWETATVFDPGEVPPSDCEVLCPLRYTYVNGDGCASINDTVMTVHPLPDPDFIAADVCAYDSLIIINTSTIGCGTITGWQWAIPGHGTLNTVDVGPFLYGHATIPISLTATSSYGCTATYSVTAIVHPIPMAAFSVPDTCQYDPVPYTDESTIAWNTGVDVINAWAWHFGDDTTSSDQHPTHAWQEWGDFADTLTVTSVFGCANTAISPITVHPAPVNSMVFAPNCFGESTPIESTSIIPLGSIVDTWWELETPVVFAYSGVAIAHAFSASPPFFHPITLYTRSDQGCTAMTADTIEIWPLPRVDYNLSQTELCAQGSVVFSDASSIPLPYQNTTWTWLINGEPWGTGQTTELVFPDSGTYDVALVVGTANGCTDSLANTAQVLVHPLPIAGFSANPAHTDLYRPEVQFTDSSQGAVQWVYHFGEGGFSHLRNPLYRYATFGTYTVQQVVANEFDCTDTAYAQVIMDPEIIIYVPNSFTPDGDGVNDLFMPSLAGFGVRDYEFTVWDRWGECIFSTTDATKAWDGKMKGELVKNDVYLWELEVSALEFAVPRHLHGHVTVLR